MTKSSTMASLLDRILGSRSPIVVGYGGWQGDVFMTALYRWLNGEALQNNLYWFLYQTSDVEALPNWLRDHPNVRFVIPEETGETLETQYGQETRQEADVRPIETNQEPVRAEGEKDTEANKLPAYKVFEEMIMAFNLPPPRLTEDPLNYFAQQLIDAIPAEDMAEDANSRYAFKKVLKDIGDAANAVASARALARVSPDEALAKKHIEAMYNAIRRAQYRDAIASGQEILGSALSPDKREELVKREELIELFMNAATGLLDDSDEELAAYDAIIRIGTSATNLSPKEQRFLGRALWYKGVTLARRDRRDDAVAVYDQLINRFGQATELVLQKQVARALVSKGLALAWLDRDEEEIAAYDELIRRFGQAKGTVLQEQVAKALRFKGMTLSKLDRGEEAIAVYDEVIRRAGEAKEPVLEDQVARALVSKGLALLRLDRREEEIAVYDQLIRYFGQAKDPTLREQIAKGLLLKGITLSQLDRREEAIPVYDEVIRRFGEAREPALREPLARALVLKGLALARLDRREEAIPVYDEVIRRFGEAREPALREQVAGALNNKGFALLCNAKKYWLSNDDSKGREALATARQAIQRSLERRPDDAITLGNLAYVQFLEGDEQAAEATLGRAITLGGEEIRQAALSDTQICTLPLDNDFRALVERI